MDTQIQAHTAGEAAKVLGVTVAMIYRWLDDGTLTEMYLRGGRVRLVEASSLARLKKQREDDGARGAGTTR